MEVKTFDKYYFCNYLHYVIFPKRLLSLNFMFLWSFFFSHPRKYCIPFLLIPILTFLKFFIITFFLYLSNFFQDVLKHNTYWRYICNSVWCIVNVHVFHQVLNPILYDPGLLQFLKMLTPPGQCRICKPVIIEVSDIVSDISVSGSQTSLQ